MRATYIEAHWVDGFVVFTCGGVKVWKVLPPTRDMAKFFLPGGHVAPMNISANDRPLWFS